MTTPSTTIYVRPGWASYLWSYAGAVLPAGAATSAVTAVAFDATSSLGQQLSRGNLQYSQDNGRSWADYAAPLDAQGAYLPATGLVWRFQDRTGFDDVTPNTFSVHYKLANGSTVTLDNTVIIDNPPASLVGRNDLMFSTLQTGALVDTLAAIDNGSLTGTRWTIDSQSQPGLFAIDYNPAVDTTARLVLANSALLPAAGESANVTVHYYDRFQLDTAGNPILGQGVARILSYVVEDGVSHSLAGLGADLALGAAVRPAWGSGSADPALAHLTGGGFVAVWQGTDSVAGGAGAGLWAQLRDAGGAALGAAFALTPDGDARVEGQPAVAALANGRFALAYTVLRGDVAQVAYKVVGANGAAGAEHVVASGALGDAGMPALATLADGTLALAWRGGGMVHVQGIAADGALAGAQQDYAALGSAFSPAIAAFGAKGYVVSWGEMGDGNVYAATTGAPASFLVSGDGYAASVSTAAPLPHVAALAGGGFVVTWDSYVNAPHGFASSDVFFQRYDGAGNALGAATQANVDSFGGRFDAAVTSLSDGSFMVAWQGGDDDGNGVWGRRFGADGAVVDEREFAINGGRSGDQSGVDIVGLDGGGFAAAWSDMAADGSVSVEARVLPGAVVGTAQGVAASMAASTAASTVGASLLAGNGSDDLLHLPHGASRVDGAGGVDTLAVGGMRAGTAIVKDGAGFQLLDAAGDHASLVNVERLQFDDKMVALDSDGVAGSAYRLYQMFDRAPDQEGLGYWISALDHGAPLARVADDFVHSAEFGRLYGAQASDSQFLSTLYQMVLHRAPDAEGFAWWMEALHGVSRASVVIDFTDSPENIAQTVGATANGIDYLQWGA